MKMRHDYWACPQSWTLNEICAHMTSHNLTVIAVLTGENNTKLAGIIVREHLVNLLATPSLNAGRLTAKEAFDALNVRTI